MNFARNALLSDEILFQEEPHAYIYRGKTYRSVTDHLTTAGLSEDFSMVPADRLEYARRRGQMVHRACELLANGELDWYSVDPRIHGYVEAYRSFLSIKTLKIMETEKKLVYPALRLAGRPDLVCWIDGYRAIIDLKSGQAGNFTGPQTAGYKILWDFNYPKRLIQKRYRLRLNAPGTFQLIPLTDPLDVNAFMDALHYSQRKERVEEWKTYYNHGEVKNNGHKPVEV